MWQSVEFFLKDGRSYLFNLFNDEINDKFIEVIKVNCYFIILNNNIFIIF